MTNPQHWHSKWFADHTRLQAPDWLLSTDEILMCRYSDMDKLREWLRENKQKSVYLLMDGHLGEYGVPRTDFTAVTPFGFFNVSIGKLNIKGDMAWDGKGCVECIWSVWPCSKHLS